MGTQVDDTLPATRPAGTGSRGESESESTHTQGLFTGSIEAIRRARGFTGARDEPADSVADGGSDGRTDRT